MARWSVVARRLLAAAAPAALAVVAGCGAAPATAPPARSHPVPTRVPTSTAPAAPSPTTTDPTPTTVTAPTPTSTTGAPGAGLQVGPGTQAAYTVQAQPAPGTCHYRWSGPDPLPDPACTPGATNPQVTPADLGSTICFHGWTATVRPPTGVTDPEKVGSAAAYGYTGPFSTAEYDHLVPLELGGDPNDPANLWVEPNDRPGATSTANSKDVLENRLRELVCDGSLSLAEAQVAIAGNWVAALQRFGG